MIIRGIDPGDKYSGYVDFDTEQYKVVGFAEEMNNDELFEDLQQSRIDYLAIEHLVNRGQANKTILKSAYWEGIFTGLVKTRGIPYIKPSAAVIRTQIVGANCSDTRTKQALKEKYSHIAHFTDQKDRKAATDGRVTLRSHAAQAFAVVAYFLETVDIVQ